MALGAALLPTQSWICGQPRRIIQTVSELELRPTTHADAERLLAFYRTVAATPNSGLARQGDEITPDYVAAVLAHPGNDCVSISAFLGRALAGEIHATRMRPRQFNHVLTDLTIAVDPVMQGRGVGSLLFGALLEAAAGLVPPVTRIELVARTGNSAAIRLYERLGFRAEGRFHGRVRLPDGTIEDDIPMAKMLGAQG